MYPTKETLYGAVGDPQFRSALLQGVLSSDAELILKSSYRCDPPSGGSEEVRTQFFSQKGLVLWSDHRKPPEPVFGKRPQISCTSDCQQLVLFASGELAIVRSRRFSGSNNIYNYGVGEHIEETTVDSTPLTDAEFEHHRARISDELWRRICTIGGSGRENGDVPDIDMDPSRSHN
jgi:hypothetical protein